MEDEPIVQVLYALTENDMRRDDLGRHKLMPLSEALKLTERMLKGSYVMVKIVKVKIT